MNLPTGKSCFFHETEKRLYDHPVTNPPLTFVQPLPIGLVASSVSAAILRRRPG